MQLHTFAADSAADAIAQIREQLGPEAVILSVKKLPAPGLGRLWQRPRIELLACVPDKPGPAPDTLGEIKTELAELRLLYEPYLTALADRFLMPVPGWFPANEMADNWQTTAWAGRGVVRL